MSDEHKPALKLATASFVDLIARAHTMQAAVLRDASRQELEAMRSQAHDLLDAYLDHMTAASTHVRAILEP